METSPKLKENKTFKQFSSLQRTILTLSTQELKSCATIKGSKAMILNNSLLLKFMQSNKCRKKIFAVLGNGIM